MKDSYNLWMLPPIFWKKLRRFSLMVAYRCDYFRHKMSRPLFLNTLTTVHILFCLLSNLLSSRDKHMTFTTEPAWLWTIKSVARLRVSSCQTLTSKRRFFTKRQVIKSEMFIFFTICVLHGLENA